MSEQEYQTCRTCPAYYTLTADGTDGTCRARPPVALQERGFFRGSTRSMLFGAYPVVGGFPLVKEDDYCMEHPGNRQYWSSGQVAKQPARTTTDEPKRTDAEEAANLPMGDSSGRMAPPPGSSM